MEPDMFEFAFAHPSHTAHSTLHRAAQNPVVGRLLEGTLDESLARLFTAPSAATDARSPRMDVSETDTAYTVVLDMPGVSKAQLKVSVEGRKLSVETLHVEAAATDAVAVPASRALYRERKPAKYARTVSLPAEVDAASAQANLVDGVLTLVLNKRVADGAVQVNVN
jgi:HSP20 family protein